MSLRYLLALSAQGEVSLLPAWKLESWKRATAQKDMGEGLIRGYLPVAVRDIPEKDCRG